MGHQYAEIMFTKNVKEIQEQNGSRNSYARMEQGDDYNNVLGSKEIQFLVSSDSFYLASVSEDGWPYVQHRGGPKGFVKIVDEKSIGFSDFSGNKQYISVGNFKTNDKVSLFFMDYKNRRRLKIAGRVKVIDKADQGTLEKLDTRGYNARIERGLVVAIEGFDWNCPQHITPRYTKEDLQPLLDTLAYYDANTNKSASAPIKTLKDI